MSLYVILYLGPSKSQLQIKLSAIFAFDVHAKKDFVAAIILPRYVCLDPNARDTRSDKMSNATSWMENRVVCHTNRFLSYGVVWYAFRSV